MSDWKSDFEPPFTTADMHTACRQEIARLQSEVARLEAQRDEAREAARHLLLRSKHPDAPELVRWRNAHPWLEMESNADKERVCQGGLPEA